MPLKYDSKRGKYVLDPKNQDYHAYRDRENNNILIVGLAAGAIALLWNNRNKGRPA